MVTSPQQPCQGAPPLAAADVVASDAAARAAARAASAVDAGGGGSGGGGGGGGGGAVNGNEGDDFPAAGQEAVETGVPTTPRLQVRVGRARARHRTNGGGSTQMNKFYSNSTWCPNSFCNSILQLKKKMKWHK